MGCANKTCINGSICVSRSNVAFVRPHGFLFLERKDAASRKIQSRSNVFFITFKQFLIFRTKFFVAKNMGILGTVDVRSLHIHPKKTEIFFDRNFFPKNTFSIAKNIVFGTDLFSDPKN